MTEGTVFVDGMDVRKLLRHELDQAIGMVPQKAFLFSGTLEDNLRDGKPDATQEELWEALSIAQAKEFVEKNERGLKMKVSEGGTNFSGGQRQRLAIARAIVRRPSIYLFDDSFSALDYRTDQVDIPVSETLREKIFSGGCHYGLAVGDATADSGYANDYELSLEGIIAEGNCLEDLIFVYDIIPPYNDWSKYSLCFSDTASYERGDVNSA